jgi:hypothetical protein
MFYTLIYDVPVLCISRKGHIHFIRPYINPESNDKHCLCLCEVSINNLNHFNGGSDYEGCNIPLESRAGCRYAPKGYTLEIFIESISQYVSNNYSSATLGADTSYININERQMALFCEGLMRYAISILGTDCFKKD